MPRGVNQNQFQQFGGMQPGEQRTPKSLIHCIFFTLCCLLVVSSALLKHLVVELTKSQIGCYTLKFELRICLYLYL